MIYRVLFTSAFILTLLIICIVKNEQEFALADSECLRDYTFVWTEGINTFLVENHGWKNFVIIQTSVFIDFMMVSYLVIFAIWGTSMRLGTTLAIFYPSRNVVQALFLMGRPVGFLWSDPGVMSLTVPYFDTNDFYFSGHVGSTTIFSSEYLACKWYKMAAICIWAVIDAWVCLMFLRTHYIIDFLSGYVFARCVHRVAEKISYYPDVKLLGYAKQKRTAHNYDPCPKCGWGNKAVLKVTSKEDLDLQRKLYANLLAHNKLSNGSESTLMNEEGL